MLLQQAGYRFLDNNATPLGQCFDRFIQRRVGFALIPFRFRIYQLILQLQSKRLGFLDILHHPIHGAGVWGSDSYTANDRRRINAQVKGERIDLNCQHQSPTAHKRLTLVLLSFLSTSSRSVSSEN